MLLLPKFSKYREVSSKAGHRRCKSWPVQEESDEIQSMYGQAEYIQVDRPMVTGKKFAPSMASLSKHYLVPSWLWTKPFCHIQSCSKQKRVYIYWIKNKAGPYLKPLKPSYISQAEYIVWNKQIAINKANTNLRTYSVTSNMLILQVVEMLWSYNRQSVREKGL